MEVIYNDLIKKICLKISTNEDYKEDMIFLLKILKNHSIIDKNLKIKQICELLKVKKIYELSKEILNKNKSVVVFLNYLISVNLLENIIINNDNEIKNNYGIISKQTDFSIKNSYIKDFQNNKLNFLILTFKTSSIGISLHDKKNIRPRESIISLFENDFDINQIFGRINKINIKSDVIQNIILLKNKIDEKLFNNFIKEEN